MQLKDTGVFWQRASIWQSSEPSAHSSISAQTENNSVITIFHNNAAIGWNGNKIKSLALRMPYLLPEIYIEIILCSEMPEW